MVHFHIRAINNFIPEKYQIIEKVETITEIAQIRRKIAARIKDGKGWIVIEAYSEGEFEQKLDTYYGVI